jgi:hypothetical protein
MGGNPVSIDGRRSKRQKDPFLALPGGGSEKISRVRLLGLLGVARLEKSSS